jgi:Haem-NO-binding
MHGIVLTGLQRYVGSTLGTAAWGAIVDEAGLDRQSYLATEEYPDGEVVALIGAASRRASMPVPELVAGFGEFITPLLLTTYRAFIKPQWDTLDLLEHVEATIHSVVRQRTPGARPPVLTMTRTGADEVTLVYGSPRKLCALAKGIARGIANHYRQRLTITDLACMHQGDPFCRIAFRVVPDPART